VRRGDAVTASIVAFVLVAGFAAGCSRSAPPERAPAPAPMPTVDVTEAPDAHASLDNEAVEKRRAAPAGGIAGMLPEGFPRDVPLPSPSSLVDFGSGSHGGASVTLEVQRAPDRALADYEAQLRAAGFRREGDGSWTLGSRRIGVSVASFSGIARISVEILAAAGKSAPPS
jgi:hypothetical protein